MLRHFCEYGDGTAQLGIYFTKVGAGCQGFVGTADDFISINLAKMTAQTNVANEYALASSASRIGHAQLDCLSQASALLATLPLADGVRMDIEGTGCVRLASWIPSRISSIIDGISVSIVSRAGNHITLAFTSRGHLVQGLDFSYFDGRSWSPVRHCPSGRTSVELAPGALGEHVQVMLANALRDRGMKVVGKAPIHLLQRL